jgi:hypothetical protein
MLTSLDQNGKWAGTGTNVFPVADGVPPAYGWNLSRSSGICAERGKPVSLPSKGKRSARRADGDAGMGFRKKRTPFRNGADRD